MLKLVAELLQARRFHTLAREQQGFGHLAEGEFQREGWRRHNCGAVHRAAQLAHELSVAHRAWRYYI